MSNLVAVPNAQAEQSDSNSGGINQNAPFIPDQPEAPFTLFERDNHTPYTVKYFGLENVMAPEAESYIRGIEDYITSQITENNYHDSTATYNQIVTNIKEILGIQEYEHPLQQLQKIYSFTSLNNSKNPLTRTSQADELDQARLSKDVTKNPIFNKQVDKVVQKQFKGYLKEVNKQVKRLDQELTMKLEPELQKLSKLSKVEKLLKKYF